MSDTTEKQAPSFDDATKQAMSAAVAEALHWEPETVPANEILTALDAAGYKLSGGKHGK